MSSIVCFYCPKCGNHLSVDSTQGNAIYVHDAVPKQIVSSILMNTIVCSLCNNEFVIVIDHEKKESLPLKLIPHSKK